MRDSIGFVFCRHYTKAAESRFHIFTLTLSHGEREQSAASSIVREVRRADPALGCGESQRRILPLPEGEGRGEGKGGARFANHVGTSPEARRSAEEPFGFEQFILSCLRLCRR